ncbi:hypothetical protein AB9F46_35800, partial [Rhizobium leguminosarum]|uniref:hypothetical protein n=1 Tax=Rhizobium leguminosarum TaxID=384 RepID=UPI003F9BBBE3
EAGIPALDDFLPDRGLAKLPEEPYDSNTSVEQTDPSCNSLDVTAGANLVVNVASVINTGFDLAVDIDFVIHGFGGEEMMVG